MAAVAVGEDSNEQRLEVKVGDSIALTLAENRTTGYRWQVVAAGEPICQLARQAFDTADASKPGAPGLLRCEFLVLKPGSARIQLDSKRAWSGSVVRSFTLEVSAR